MVNGTSYYASQTISGCESATRFQVIATVTTTSTTPFGNSNQSIPVANANDATLSNLVVNPTSVLWYATLTDAQNQTNPLLLSTIVTNGSTYYAVNNATGCPSLPFAVTVTVLLSNEVFSRDDFSMYPNPVDDILYLKNDTSIKSLRIINLIGKEVLNKSVNVSELSLDLSQLEAGTYIILLDINDEIKSIKFIKK